MSKLAEKVQQELIHAIENDELVLCHPARGGIAGA